MASNDETPEVARPTTVDTPPVTGIRPPAPRDGDDHWPPVEMTPPRPPHQPKHAAPEATTVATRPTTVPGVDVMASRRRVLDERRERFDRARARPGVRYLLPALLITAMLAVAGVAGAYVIPATSKPRADGSISAPTPEGTGVLDPTDAPAAGDPPRPEVSASSPGYSPPPGTHDRPADALGAWAGTRSVRLDIPLVALQAYGYAELVTARTTPKCKLTWTTLAGIGKIESDHGRTNHSVLQDDGRSNPPIIGPPLDGQNGRQAVADTDQGQLDNDRTWDRAVGPMQFLPATWRQYGLDADADGVADINDIDDAALTAAAFLCANGRDLSTLDGWNAAIHAYNVPEEYRAAVFNATNDYGRRDHQG